MSEILRISNLSKIYQSGNKSLTVLKDINLSINKGELVSIVGHSGSGKTTLLGLCAGLDTPSTGDIFLCGENITSMGEDEKAVLRSKKVGFVFQNFQLMPSLTALENVMMPLDILGLSNARKASEDLLGRVGLSDRINHYPNQLSGGEQQRVSIARAFSNNPEILFADEPTGNLDEETGASIEALMFDINKEFDTTMVLVTHNMELAKRTNRIIKLKGGQLV